jgi:arsenate reductase
MTTIYHNPRCSKSRQALELLVGRGIEPKIIEYLKAPPTAEQLLALCARMGLRPVQLVRTRERRFRELGLSLDDRRSDGAWCRILSENPVLIERPIVVSGRRAVLGRPPERVLEIL